MTHSIFDVCNDKTPDNRSSHQRMSAILPKCCCLLYITVFSKGQTKSKSKLASLRFSQKQTDKFDLFAMRRVKKQTKQIHPADHKLLSKLTDLYPLPPCSHMIKILHFRLTSPEGHKYLINKVFLG